MKPYLNLKILRYYPKKNVYYELFEESTLTWWLFLKKFFIPNFKGEKNGRFEKYTKDFFVVFD